MTDHNELSIEERIAQARAAISAAETPDELKQAKTQLLALTMFNGTDNSSILTIDAALHARRQEHAEQQQRLADARLRKSEDRLTGNNPL